MTMRIGFVTGEYPPMQGGVGAFTRELARAMLADGHEIHVHTRREAAGGAEPGINLQAVMGRYGWRSPAEIREWTQANKLDVVNFQFQTAAFNMHPAIHFLPRALRDIPVAVTFHDLRVPYLFPKAGPLREYAVKMLAREAALAIATDRTEEFCLRDEWQVSNVARIPIGSNVTPQPPAGYDRHAWRQKLGIDSDTLLVGYFGFLNATKGGLELVETLAKLVADGLDAHMVMIGGKVGASDTTNAAYGQTVEAAITQANLAQRVHWTGYVDDEAVSGHFMAADIIALPYHDGLSLRRGTLMAALAHGRAIVTTEAQIPVPELESCVATIPLPPQPEALAGAITRLWHNPPERGKLEQAAHAASGRFSWQAIAHETLAQFEMLLG